jgi:hypothetical protein
VPKDQFLVLRFERDDLERVRKVAEKDHLAPATWARQALLKAVDAWERKEARRNEK